MIQNKLDRTNSVQQSVEGEGGDASSAKVAPFPGYRDEALLKAEELYGDGDWSVETYDSEEENHMRNTFFSFLGLIFCCVLIVLSIVIVYMASTSQMKSTTIVNQTTELLMKTVKASVAAGVTVAFGNDKLQNGVEMSINMKIEDITQTGWSVSINAGDTKEDIVLTFATSEVTVSNSAGASNKVADSKLADLFEKNDKNTYTISFKMSK